MTGDVREFRLPDLGEGLTEAQILTWLVEVGEEIAVDQPVVEVETAKATVEIPSPYAGTVCVRHAESGQAIEVGAPLLSVLTGDGVPDGDGPPERVLVGYGAEPTTRRRRRRLVDPPPPSAGGERRIVLRGADRTAALRMAQGHREVPTATTWVEADATELLAARAALNAGERRAGLLALLALCCVTALRRHPRLNARMDADRLEVVEVAPVHLGFAVQTERALVVPVIRDAHTRSVGELDAEIRRLVAAARAGMLAPAELTGGTFTLNDYGGYGVDGAVPLLNHPEAGMLGVGRIARRPWMVGEQVTGRDVVQLSLTFDHRVCHGNTAGSFLRFVADCVERPWEHLDLPAADGD